MLLCLDMEKKKQKMRRNGKKGTIEEILNVLDYAGCVVLIFLELFSSSFLLQSGILCFSCFGLQEKRREFIVLLTGSSR